MAYRLTQGDLQARFDALGCLTHIGHPDRIRESPTCFYTTGPLREGHWHVSFGRQDILVDPEVTRRAFDLEAGTLTLTTEYRGPGSWWGFDFTRAYRLDSGLLRCDFSIENWSRRKGNQLHDWVASAARLRRLRYSTGVNSWTDYASDWAHRPYPTNLRVEAGFFWAGLISTSHDVIGYFTPGKVDSWRVIYEGQGMQRIRSVAIDVVNSIDPHPDRVTHQDIRLSGAAPRYAGTLYVGRFESMEALWQKAADVLQVAFLAPDRCAGFVGETLRLPVIAPARSGGAAPVRAHLSDESDRRASRVLAVHDGALALPLEGGEGRTVIELDAGGQRTEARIWRQDGWARTLRAAARYAATVKRPSGFNAESVLGVVTLAQARRLLGEESCGEAARQVLDETFSVYVDPTTGRNRRLHSRAQNYGSLLDAIRVYHDRTGDPAFLDRGQRSAEQLLSLQHGDGHFYNRHAVYTNVIHPAKSLFDWARHLSRHGRDAEAQRLMPAVERAYRAIAREGDDSMTEGSDHFEDGMTACAGYQIASLGPHFGWGPAERRTAEAIFRKRRMLKPRVPDSRFFGSTLRHWETYWALGLGSCMLGGYGWNAWSASFSHALFMATGRWEYLLDAYATISNGLQAVDVGRGVFNFGFSVDPFWYDYCDIGTAVAGEQYVPFPDEIEVAGEQHAVFLTLDASFYRQVYVRVRANGVEVLNGRVASAPGAPLELESYALDMEEIVVVLEDGIAVAPPIRVAGRQARVTELRRTEGVSR